MGNATSSSGFLTVDMSAGEVIMLAPLIPEPDVVTDVAFFFL